jgi:hypothetical protein
MKFSGQKILIFNTKLTMDPTTYIRQFLTKHLTKSTYDYETLIRFLAGDHPQFSKKLKPEAVIKLVSQLNISLDRVAWSLKFCGQTLLLEDFLSPLKTGLTPIETAKVPLYFKIYFIFKDAFLTDDYKKRFLGFLNTSSGSTDVVAIAMFFATHHDKNKDRIPTALDYIGNPMAAQNYRRIFGIPSMTPAQAMSAGHKTSTSSAPRQTAKASATSSGSSPFMSFLQSDQVSPPGLTTSSFASPISTSSGVHCVHSSSSESSFSSSAGFLPLSLVSSIAVPGRSIPTSSAQTPLQVTYPGPVGTIFGTYADDVIQAPDLAWLNLERQFDLTQDERFALLVYAVPRVQFQLRDRSDLVNLIKVRDTIRRRLGQLPLEQFIEAWDQMRMKSTTSRDNVAMLITEVFIDYPNTLEAPDSCWMKFHRELQPTHDEIITFTSCASGRTGIPISKQRHLVDLCVSRHWIQNLVHNLNAQTMISLWESILNLPAIPKPPPRPEDEIA